MTLLSLKVTDFRCLASAEIQPDPHYNLIYGANAAGKTSLLEAIGYLGRGRSFRGASTNELIRHGCSEILLQGTANLANRAVPVGVRNGSGGLEIRIDSENAPSAAALATALPLQIVDPEVHSLVAGGPEGRRRYLDWIAFHVEQGYLESWRRFRRALKQRNAALRAGESNPALATWDREFLETASEIHAVRQQIVGLARPLFEEKGRALLGSDATLLYRPGWKAELTLAQALQANSVRDRELGTTHAGPQRSDLSLVLDERQAKRMVSRGQQKLLACALILTATELAQNQLERPLLLLLDDPAAELDKESLQRLMQQVVGLGCQVIATALAPDKALFPANPALFHVEQGVLNRAC